MFTDTPEKTIFSRKPASGYGFELYRPHNPRSFENIQTIDDPQLIFEEVNLVLDAIHSAPNNNLLLYGQPGSGKSHIRDDLAVQAALKPGVPYLSLSLHINGSREEGALVAGCAIDALRRSSSSQKLLIVDNVDYIGYRGHGSRTRKRARGYALPMSKVLAKAMDDPAIAVLGLAHDQEWREGRWTWNDPAIDVPASKVVNGFKASLELAGQLTDFGLLETLRERGMDQPEQFAAKLASDGLKSFFFAKHLDPQLYAESPESAIEQINIVRERMKHR